MEIKDGMFFDDNFEKDIQKMIKRKKQENIKKFVMSAMAMTSIAAAAGATKDLYTAADYAGRIGLGVCAVTLFLGLPKEKEITRNEAIKLVQEQRYKKAKQRAKIDRVIDNAKEKIFKR
ncbi:MAG: hypothetical protein IJ837_02235 [Clostridia bacterium]|nr:hypothetical protein [Clostridia bacterium]